MEELYRSLYSKYGGDLSEAEINEKVNYAMTLSSNDFINSFYDKYTGSGPSREQQQYISSYSIAENVRKGRVDDMTRENLLDTYSGGIGVVKAVLPYIYNFAGGSARIISGIAKAGEGVLENFQGMTREEQIEDGLNPLSQTLDKYSEYTDKFDKVYRDEFGNRQDVFQLIAKGQYGRAARLGSEQAAESAPSTLISIGTAIVTKNPKALTLGTALLGMSAAGGQYKEDLVYRPEETTNAVIKNALLAGISEFGTEYLGGKFAKGLYGLGKVGATEKVYNEYTKSFVGNFLKKAFLGAGGEALTESANAVIQKSGNQYIYGDQVTQKEYISDIVNSAVPAFILGGIGGGLSALN